MALSFSDEFSQLQTCASGEFFDRRGSWYEGGEGTDDPTGLFRARAKHETTIALCVSRQVSACQSPDNLAIYLLNAQTKEPGGLERGLPQWVLPKLKNKFSNPIYVIDSRVVR